VAILQLHHLLQIINGGLFLQMKGVKLSLPLLQLIMQLKGEEVPMFATLHLSQVNSGGRGPVSAEWFVCKSLWLKRNDPATYQEAHYICECCANVIACLKTLLSSTFVLDL